MVINHLLNGMILQAGVGCFFLGRLGVRWDPFPRVPAATVNKKPRLGENSGYVDSLFRGWRQQRQVHGSLRVPRQCHPPQEIWPY